MKTAQLEDHMRYNLVTAFRCQRCGSQLRLTYAGQRFHPYEPEKESGITGACKVEQVISIYPCEKCFDKATAPIKALREALGIKEPS